MASINWEIRWTWFVIVSLSGILVGAGSNFVTTVPDLRLRIAALEYEVADQRKHLTALESKLDTELSAIHRRVDHNTSAIESNGKKLDVLIELSKKKQ